MSNLIGTKQAKRYQIVLIGHALTVCYRQTGFVWIEFDKCFRSYPVEHCMRNENQTKGHWSGVGDGIRVLWEIKRVKCSGWKSEAELLVNQSAIRLTGCLFCRLPVWTMTVSWSPIYWYRLGPSTRKKLTPLYPHFVEHKTFRVRYKLITRSTGRKYARNWKISDVSSPYRNRWEWWSQSGIFLHFAIPEDKRSSIEHKLLTTNDR